MQYIDINTLLQSYNRKADRMTMAFSVEERVPFQDYRLLEASFSLPENLRINEGNEKYVIKKIGQKYLPKETIEREKRGYGVPIFYWIKNLLKEDMENRLDASLLVEDGIFTKNLRKKVRYHHNSYFILFGDMV